MGTLAWVFSHIYNPFLPSPSPCSYSLQILFLYQNKTIPNPLLQAISSCLSHLLLPRSGEAPPAF